MTGHIIKVTLGNDEEVVFSVGEDQLQKMFFLILKIING
jgi:hypothetical protein